MILKKCFIIITFCVLSYCSVHAQGLYRQTNPQQSCSSIPQETLKIDLSKTPDTWFPIPNSNSPQRAGSGWYPIKGEVYMDDETKIAGYIYHTIGQNGLLDKKIIVGNNPNLYDSTVSVMNRTPYTKGKDLIDTTYNYCKNPDGSYRLDMRRTYSYHYFDHFEADSFYYEYIYHFWDDANKQWKNFYREKIGYHDTLVQFFNRNSKYIGEQGNTWTYAGSTHDSITYNEQGFVDSLYRIVNLSLVLKIGFTHDEQGRYTHADSFIKQGDTWVKNAVYSNYTWKEWNGFMYGREISINGEMLSPYKRTKFDSYDNVSLQPPYLSSFYQKLWDINGTMTNVATTYRVKEEKKYPLGVWENIYNEYDDYVAWRNTGYSEPDENGKQEINFYSEMYWKYTYDEIYGMTETKLYQIVLTNGKMDTTFLDGIKYTEFAPYDVSITEQQEANQIAIYPNPGNNMITIGIDSDDFIFRLYDLTGKLILEQQNEKNISTEFLPSGMYLYRVFSEHRATASGKWVKY